MKYLALACALLLGSCARHKPSPAPHAEPIGVILPPGDTEFTRINSDNPAENGPARPGVVVQPPRTMLDKLTGRTPKPQYYPLGTPVTTGKKATVTIYNAPATVTTVGKKATAATGEGATVIAPAKKAGPVVVADSGAVVQLATSKKGPAAAAGHDATATVEESGWPWWLWVVLVGGSGFLIYRGYKRFFSV